jgi:hypothetical protein
MTWPEESQLTHPETYRGGAGPDGLGVIEALLELPLVVDLAGIGHRNSGR